MRRSQSSPWLAAPVSTGIPTPGRAGAGVVLLRFATAENSFTGSYTLKKKSKVLMQGQAQSWFFPEASGGFYINAEWTQTGACS